MIIRSFISVVVVVVILLVNNDYNDNFNNREELLGMLHKMPLSIIPPLQPINPPLTL